MPDFLSRLGRALDKRETTMWRNQGGIGITDAGLYPIGYTSRGALPEDTAVELSELRGTWSAEFIPIMLIQPSLRDSANKGFASQL